MDTKGFIKKLGSREASKTLNQKFWDFCELAYCAYAKPLAEKEQQDALEARYIQIIGTYRDKDAIRAYPALISDVYKGLQGGDFLGVVAGEIGALSGEQGQFFTPFEVSRLMAEMLLDERIAAIEERGYLTVEEPAAGAGGMILALAQALKRRGYDPETQLYVHATDINALAYWMCFLQLSLANIPANVIRGNSLSLETFETSMTMACIPFFGRHDKIFEEPVPEPNNIVLYPHPIEIKQLALF